MNCGVHQPAGRLGYRAKPFPAQPIRWNLGYRHDRIARTLEKLLGEEVASCASTAEPPQLDDFSFTVDLEP